MDLTEVEDIKRGGKNVENNCTKKNLNDPENHNGVITHPEPNILEAKWALESIMKNKASGGEEIPAELFHIIKDDAVKVPHSICQQTENSVVATGLEKVSFLSNPKEEQCQRMFKCGTIALISHSSKVMLKIL